MIKLPKFIGHRGAAGFAAENTLASIRIAKKCGAQIVEFDVKQTKDGMLVVMHDDTVDRTTNGTGFVSNLTFKEIRSLDAGSWFDPTFADEKVPTLAEMFQVLSETHMTANIEIKPCPNNDKILAKHVVQFIKEHWPKEPPPPIVSSFSLESLRVAREENPSLLIGLLFDDPVPSNWKTLVHELHPCFISLNQKSVTETLVKEIHRENLAALAYTVNDIVRAQELYNMGIDSIFTNYPGAFNL